MKRIFLILTTSLVCMNIHAQDSATLTLTLDKAIEIAMSESQTIKLAEKEIERVDYSKQSAWQGLIPTLTASGQFEKYLAAPTMSLGSTLIEMPTNYNASAGISLSLPLFAPALWQSIKMTALDMQLAVEKAQASKITLRNDVSKAFYGILLAKDSYKTLQAGLKLAEDMYEQTKKRFENGLVSEFDVISAEVQVQNLKPTILEVENGIEQAKMFLKVLIGIEMAQAIDVQGVLTDYENVVSANAQMNLAVDGNTDLKQLDIQQQLLQKSLSIQRTQRMPTLAAFGNFGHNWTRNNSSVNFITQQLDPASSSNYGQGLLAGLQLSVPLTGIFTNISKEKQTKVQMDQLSLQRDYLESSLNVQAQSAYNMMTVAKNQAEAAQKNSELAQRGYDIATKRYETGMGIMLEVQNASNQLMQAQLSYHQSIVDYLNAKSDLEKLLGITE
ncbi:MAG: TolC family protein [Bacteroidales bacterium]|jgi:outer membrane protein TolC|nr:TolC family protein [Bacteroidales bacterium]